MPQPSKLAPAPEDAARVQLRNKDLNPTIWIRYVPLDEKLKVSILGAVIV